MNNLKTVKLLVKQSLVNYLANTSKLHLCVLIASFVLQAVSTFIVCFELGNELASVLFSAGLYGAVLALSELLFFIFAILYAQKILYKIKSSGGDLFTETSAANIAVADFIIIYSICLVLYLCTVIPLSVVFINLSNNYLKNAFIAFVLAIFMPLLPCSVSSFITRSVGKSKSLRTTISFFCDLAKITLYVFAIYIFSTSNCYGLATFITDISTNVQTIFFPSGYVVRSLHGNGIEALMLVLISIATAAIPLTVALKNER